MEWLDSITRLVDALAWPAVVLLLAHLFKDSLADLASELRELRYKEFGARFGQKVEDLEDRAAEAGLQEPRGAQAERPDATRLATISPRAAIFEAWRQIELTLRELAQAKGYDEKGSSHRLIDKLASDQVLPENTVGLLNDMRVLRNEAVHQTNVDIDPSDAVEFADLARRVRESVRNLHDEQMSFDH